MVTHMDKMSAPSSRERAQRLYDKVIELENRCRSYGPSNIRIVPFPTHEYTDDEFQSIIKSVMCVLHLLGFLYPISRLISYSVFEKEQKIRGLYMMGLEDGIFHLSWFIAYDLQFAVSFAIITVCTMDNHFKYSDKIVVFIHFFGLSAIMPYLRVPVPSTQLFDQDFPSHLIDLNAQVVD
ncbi:unnamed protein product [Prunus brigantina]